MITNTDVAQLNQSMNTLGDSFMQTRMLKDRENELANENRFRQESLDIAKDRNRIAEQDDKTRAEIAQKKMEIEDFLKMRQRAQEIIDRGDENGNPLPQAEIDKLEATFKQHPGWQAMDATLRLQPQRKAKPNLIMVPRDAGVYDPTKNEMVVPKPTTDHSQNFANDYTEVITTEPLPIIPAVPEKSHIEPGFMGQTWGPFGTRVIDTPAQAAITPDPEKFTKKTIIRTPNKFIGSRTNSPSMTAAPATPTTKAQLANQIAAQHPTWTRQQIIDAVNKQFAQ